MSLVVDSADIRPVKIVEDYPAELEYSDSKNISYMGHAITPRGSAIQYADGTLKEDSFYFEAEKKFEIGDMFPCAVQEQYACKRTCVTIPVDKKENSEKNNCPNGFDYREIQSGKNIGHLFIVANDLRWVYRFEFVKTSFLYFFNRKKYARITAIYDKFDLNVYETLDEDHVPSDVIIEYIRNKDPRIIPFIKEAMTTGNTYMTTAVRAIRSKDDIHILEWLRDNHCLIQDGSHFAVLELAEKGLIDVLEWWMTSSGLTFDYPDFLMRNLGSYSTNYKVMDWFAKKFGAKLRFTEDSIDHLLNTRYCDMDHDEIASIKKAQKSLDWWVSYSINYGVELKYSYGKDAWWFNDAYTDEKCYWKQEYTKFLKQFPAKEYLEEDMISCCE